MFINFSILYRLLCPSNESVSPALIAINLNNNNIERITTDPFQYCKKLKYVSMANNSIHRLENGKFNELISKNFFCNFHFKDFLRSSFELEFLNLSLNALDEFNGEVLTQNKRLIELDVSHNQITTLKLNEVTTRYACNTF